MHGNLNRLIFVLTTTANDFLTNSKTNIMTANELKKIAFARLNSLKTEELVAEVKKLTANLSDGADIIVDCILDILIERMPEDEFVALCDSL